MTYILAFMMCISSPAGECRYVHFDLPDERTCAAMKRLVLAEAKDEGFKAHAVCAPIAIETESRATSLPNFPRQ